MIDKGFSPEAHTIEHIKQSLDALAAGILRSMPEDERVLAGWRHICGAQAAEHAHAISYRDGKLQVDVDDAAWLATLTQLRGQYSARLRALTGVPVEHLEFALAAKRPVK
jgi:predicted nucleic acid-binding Zn ribbon protein